MLAAESAMETLLIVDDEKNVALALKRILRQEGYQILMARDGDEGLALLNRHPVQVVVSDHRMQGMSGLEFLRQVRQRHVAAARILMSSAIDGAVITSAFRAGDIHGFFPKPWDNAHVKEVVREARS